MRVDNKGSNETKFPIFRRILSSDALLIAALPVMAYLLLFAFYEGYFSVYNLPYQFMNFELSDIVVMSGTIFLFFFLIIWLNGMVAELFRFIPKPIRRRLGITVLMAILLFATQLLAGDEYSRPVSPTLLLGIVAFYLLLAFVVPLSVIKDKVSYLRKLELFDDRDSETQDEESSSQRKDFLFWKIVHRAPELILIGLVLFVASSWGRFVATSQVQYRVVSTEPEKVVLWLTNDYAVCAPFDRQTNEVTQAFVILKLGDDPDIEYRWEYLGHLKLAPSDNPDTSGAP